MPNRGPQRGLYDLHDPSIAQRIALTIAAAAWVILAWWLLAGGGLTTASHRLGISWLAGDPIRRLALAAGFSIYFVRLQFTQFVFLKRALGWSEALAIAPWLLFIVLLLAIEGGTNPAAPGAGFALGAIAFILGSWMNTEAEYARHAWKSRPQNHGQLYTRGLFRYTRHPNYLGDVLSFSGLCLIAGAWLTAIVPLLMLAGFVFVNIPMLDAHLREHYGPAFDRYAEHTAKLFPFVY